METHLLGTDWDRHSSEASAPLCTVSVNTERLCVRVYVRGTMTGIFVYIYFLSREELLTFDDGPTELPGSLHQPNSANC